MKNKKTKIFLSVFIVSIIVIPILIFAFNVYAQVPAAEPTGGLVPCGHGSDINNRCTLCHLIVGFQKLVQYALYLAISIALVGVFFAGVIYIISTGDEGMMSAAKNFLRASLTGFALILGAWLIVNITLTVIATKDNTAKSTSENPGDMALGIGVASWFQFYCKGTVNTPPGGETCTGAGGSCGDSSCKNVAPGGPFSDCLTGTCCLDKNNKPNNSCNNQSGYSCKDSCDPGETLTTDYTCDGTSQRCCKSGDGAQCAASNVAEGASCQSAACALDHGLPIGDTRNDCPTDKPNCCWGLIQANRCDIQPDHDCSFMNCAPGSEDTAFTCPGGQFCCKTK